MMGNKGTTKHILLIVFVFMLSLHSTTAENVTATSINNNDFTNAALLNPLFEKLYRLEKGFEGQKKVNIVHIGDSHIQADFFTNTIRQALQARFGNGGYGFTFPYKLAKTNGNSYIQYSSNVEWDSRRNIYPITDVSIGLSGIGLYTDDTNFLINIEAQPPYNFNTIKLIYPTKEPSFVIRNMQETVFRPKTNTTSQIKHKIKSGETLSSIARKYSVTPESIKKANKLKSNLIHKGKTLVIIKKVIKSSKPETIIQASSIIENDSSVFINKKSVPYSSTFTLPHISNNITICAENKASKLKEYSLDGVILENDRPGLIYSNIGVNGAKISDYLKYPLFFEQLPLLNPDLIIISFGTNESYGKWSAPYFMSQTQEFVDKIKAKNPKAIILIMSPPPSLARKNALNTFIDSYAKTLEKMNNCVYWNLLAKLGGSEVPLSNTFAEFMARDKVHYTKEGYEMQGELFLTDFMFAYANYVKNRKNWTQY